MDLWLFFVVDILNESKGMVRCEKNLSLTNVHIIKANQDGLILSSDKFLRLRLTVLFLFIFCISLLYVNMLCTFDDWRCISEKRCYY